MPAFARWFEAAGYQVSEAPGYLRFEGSGDAIWHPGRGLVWGGHGYRSEPGIYETVSDVFGVPVLRLRLLSDTFYHLDTCFCAIDERTVLIDPTALAPEFAVPHLVYGGEGPTKMLLARCMAGIRFNEDAPSVRAVVVLAGSKADRNLHLRSLAAIAQIVRSRDFDARWAEARDEQT